MKCVRRIQFCSGHRVLGHESKCANAHGHNYVAFVHAEAAELDNIGRVIDFSVLKEKLGGWINEFWDHTFLVAYNDFKLLNVKGILEANKPVFVCNFNPTAENMARHLLTGVCPILFADDKIEVTKIVLWETENCFVEAEK